MQEVLNRRRTPSAGTAGKTRNRSLMLQVELTGTAVSRAVAAALAA
jgi:hypothetical protein